MNIKKVALLGVFMGVLSLIVTSCREPSKCMAVGSARTVMITENSESPGKYTVTVKGSNPSTVLLGQRPDRTSKVIETGSFLENWENSYKASAPNVTFTSVNANRTTTNVLVLSNPKYDPESQTIVFDAEKLSSTEDSVQTGAFNNVTITYDSQSSNL